jgi:hypothetical protein
MIANASSTSVDFDAQEWISAVQDLAIYWKDGLTRNGLLKQFCQPELLSIREALDNPADPRDNVSVIAWYGLIHGWQAARVW